MTMYWIIAEAQTPAANEGTVVSSETAAPAADTTASGTQAPGGTPGKTAALADNPNAKNAQYMNIALMVVMAAVVIFMLRAPKKRQQEHQKMVAGLKKNDRIRTIGGILGTVLDVRDDEIVIKVDEGNNTKLHVIPSAIASVTSEDKKGQ
jgi:preprotein translocase subunit YajC